MKVQFAAAAILVLIVFGASAFAQKDESQKVEYRKWDVGSTVGLLVSTKRDFGGLYYGSSESFSTLNLDVDRFVTTHLKADTSVVLTQSQSYYESVYSGSPAVQYTGYVF